MKYDVLLRFGHSQGAKLFYLTGLYNNDYRKHEIHNLARFISVMKFKDLGFRLNHSFIVADRYEDLTQPDEVRKNAKCDRQVCFYGYVRGCAFKRGANVHIPGCGDFVAGDVCFLADPCELPSKEKKKRTLDDRERLLYAPMSGVGGIVYDKDAVYIELGGSHSHSKIASAAANRSSSHHNELIGQMLASKTAIDEKLTASHIELFRGRRLAPMDITASKFA
jgi:ribosome biogenesis protein BMS1